MAGRIKIKLAALINELIEKENFKCGRYDDIRRISPNDLESQPNGGSPFCDWARWKVSTEWGSHFPLEIYSWDTMTDCAKRGITLNVDDFCGGIIVYAK